MVALAGCIEEEPQGCPEQTCGGACIAFGEVCCGGGTHVCPGGTSCSTPDQDPYGCEGLYQVVEINRYADSECALQFDPESVATPVNVPIYWHNNDSSAHTISQVLPGEFYPLTTAPAGGLSDDIYWTMAGRTDIALDDCGFVTHEVVVTVALQ
jgi:hypothetical protein